jgi:hypothetical protein
MTDWLVYHSQKTMNHSYASLGTSVVYSKLQQKKLCFGDRIWVVEGSTDIPTRYTLVDCFRYADTEYPPFLPPYNGFAVRILGKGSLLPSPIPLDMTDDWQLEIRDRFLTKQRFFVSLAAEPQLVAALEAQIVAPDAAASAAQGLAAPA